MSGPVHGIYPVRNKNIKRLRLQCEKLIGHIISIAINDREDRKGGSKIDDQFFLYAYGVRRLGIRDQSRGIVMVNVQMSPTTVKFRMNISG